MYTNPDLRKPSLIYRALGNERRLYILEILSQRKLNLNQLSEILMISCPAVSRHLRLLLLAGLIKGSRVGVSVEFETSEDVDLNSLKDIKNLLTKRLD